MFRPKAYDEIAFDSDEAGNQAKILMKEKHSLREIYEEQYLEMLQLMRRFCRTPGQLVEIGSGGGFMKDICPEIMTTDVRDISGVDFFMDAMDMPFENESLRAIFATHVLHHIPDIEKFLRECDRVLYPGGGIIAIEPYYGPLATFIYKNVHPEPFDKEAKSWALTGGGPMSGANQALSYILFERDRDIFDKKYPQFELVYQRPFGFLRYMGTGGIWLPQRLPSFMFPVLKFMERTVLQPFMKWIAIHHIFVLRKCPYK